MASDLYSYSRSLQAELINYYQLIPVLQCDYSSPILTIYNLLGQVSDDKNLLRYWSTIFLLSCENSAPCIATLGFDPFCQSFNWALNGALSECHPNSAYYYAQCIDSILISEFSEMEEKVAISYALTLVEIVKSYENFLGNFEFSFKKLVNILLASHWGTLKAICQDDGPCHQVKVVIDHLVRAFRLGLNVKELIFAVTDFVFDYIKELNSNKLHDRTFKHKPEKIQVSHDLIMKLYEITEDEGYKIEINEYKLLLDSIASYVPPQKVTQKKEEVVQVPPVLKDITMIKISSVTFNETLYSVKKGNVNISVHKGLYQGVKICIKMYSSARENLDDLNRANNEIKIYEKLSKFADDTNCFLKYFGTFFDNGKIGMVMEWYEYNLSEYINILKSDNYQFDIKYYSFMTYKLLNSFKIMADNGILHNDIKPHNMLINDQLSIKIIDFDISLIKIQEENLSRTGYYGIQGTDGYLAPEQKAALNAGQNVANYNREKADVYSLGLVFYQLLTYRNLQNITTEIIEKDINDHLVYNPDIGEFLKAMLNSDPNNRPNFSQALAMLKNGPTTRSFS